MAGLHAAAGGGALDRPHALTGGTGGGYRGEVLGGYGGEVQGVRGGFGGEVRGWRYGGGA